jgi:cation:H+ antiporter
MVETIFSNVIVNVFVIVAAFIVLDFPSNIAINNAVKVSTITRLSKTAVGFSIVAFSTSLPELTVAFISALSGGTALSVGNVLGSNTVNISVVVGLAAFLDYVQCNRKAKKANRPREKDCNIVPEFANPK